MAKKPYIYIFFIFQGGGGGPRMNCTHQGYRFFFSTKILSLNSADPGVIPRSVAIYRSRTCQNLLQKKVSAEYKSATIIFQFNQNCRINDYHANQRFPLLLCQSKMIIK